MGRSEGMVVQKRMSFLSSLVWGLCSVVMVAVICGTGILFYGMRIVDTRSTDVFTLAENIFDDLPQVAKSVPLLADALQNERRLDYADDLDISVSFDEHPYREDRMRAIVTVVNQGAEQVAMLAMRLVVTDERGRIVDEDLQYVATPLAIDHHAPGPLFPGSTRRLTTGTFSRIDEPSAEYEISELRVWVDAAKASG